jgi:hypothetical protein
VDAVRRVVVVLFILGVVLGALPAGAAGKDPFRPADGSSATGGGGTVATGTGSGGSVSGPGGVPPAGGGLPTTGLDLEFLLGAAAAFLTAGGAARLTALALAR